MRYANFDIWIGGEKPSYEVMVTSPAGSARGRFQVPRQVEKWARGALGGPRARLDVEVMGEPPLEISRELSAELFREKILVALQLSLRAAQWKRKGLRIRLRLEPELSFLPWEHLRNPENGLPLALSPRTPIVRYMEILDPAPKLSRWPPVRVLIAGANPAEVCHLDLDKERRLLLEPLTWLRRTRCVVVDHLAHARLQELEDRLSRGTYHVLHFMGHGAWGAEGGVLLFENESGGSDPVSFDRLATLLGDGTLRLVVLNACEGARSSEVEPLKGVAQSLVRAGIPAVAAMQLPVSDEAAVNFTRAFYRSLSRGEPVEAAVARGRRSVLAGKSPAEWIAPVLFTRLEDGRVIGPGFWWLVIGAFLLVLSAILGVYLWQRSLPAPLICTPPPRTADGNPSECPSPPGLDMAFVLIRPGTYRIGEEDKPDSLSAREVTIERPFCIGAFEVTRKQFAMVMSAAAGKATDICVPQGSVSWDEAESFAARLTRRAGAVYRLPTEAEWEVAARAKSLTRHYFGDDDAFLRHNGNCTDGDSFRSLAPIGSFAPNEWGLYDVYGNVFEWVQSDTVVGKLRVRRGGSWKSNAESCSSAKRSLVRGDRQYKENGFRIVRELP